VALPGSGNHGHANTNGFNVVCLEPTLMGAIPLGSVGLLGFLRLFSGWTGKFPQECGNLVD
jgi:hypothetical protein